MVYPASERTSDGGIVQAIRRVVRRPLLAVIVVTIVASTVMGAVTAAIARAQPVESAGAPAAFIGTDRATYLLGPGLATRRLTPYPAVAADLAGIAIDPAAAVVAVMRHDGGGSEIVVVPIAGGPEQPVPDTRERSCGASTFHPDGAHILAVCDGTVGRSIELFHRDRGHVETMLPAGAGDIEFRIGGALVSPDGQTLIVRELLGDYGQRFWRVTPSTGQVERLVLPGPEYAVHLAGFLADGRLLATSCEQCVRLGPSAGRSPVRTEIVLIGAGMQVDGVLHTVEGLAFFPALSPDQTTLLYTTYTTGNVPQLWRLEPATGRLDQVGEGERAVYPPPSMPGIGDPSATKSATAGAASSRLRRGGS
jgi:hypothetical protein